MYESAEYRLIREFLRPDLPVIELGSSIGAISSTIARKLNPGQHLICVEANPFIISALERNLERNASHISVEVVHAAVSYEDKTVAFGVAGNNLTSGICHESASEATTVPAITLEALVIKGGRKPYQLVADIEGGEVAVLMHDRETLRRCQLIVMELHDTGFNGRTYTPTDLRNLFEQQGFEVVASYGRVVACRRLNARES
jgi:FkbM family methyltransferase